MMNEDELTELEALAGEMSRARDLGDLEHRGRLHRRCYRLMCEMTGRTPDPKLDDFAIAEAVLVMSREVITKHVGNLDH